MKRRHDWLWNLLLILAMVPVAVCVRWNLKVLQITWAAQDQWIRQIRALQKQNSVNFQAYRAAYAELERPRDGSPQAVAKLEHEILIADLDVKTVIVKEQRFFTSHPITQLDAHPSLLSRLGVGLLSMIPLTVALLTRAVSKRRYQRKVEGNLCFHCGYCLTGNTSGVCPECGKLVSAIATRITAA